MGEHNCYHSDPRECIKKKAYDLWEKDGHKPGHDMEHWLMAENNVKHVTKKDDHPKIG